MEQVVTWLAENMAGQPAALGSGLFGRRWELRGLGLKGGGDGYEDAVAWTGGLWRCVLGQRMRKRALVHTLGRESPSGSRELLIRFQRSR